MSAELPTAWDLAYQTFLSQARAAGAADPYQQAYDDAIAMYSGTLYWLPEIQDMAMQGLNNGVDTRVLYLAGRDVFDVITEQWASQFSETG